MRFGIVVAAQRFARAIAIGSFAALAGCATQAPPLTPEQLGAVLSAPDRNEADKANDERRKARELFTFIDARPGMRAMDVNAGAGYTAEMLARMVGANGHVIAHNTPLFMENSNKGRVEQRLKAYGGRNLVVSVQPYETLLPPDAAKGSLDLVTFMFNYHDLGWLGADRARLNRAVFDALKPGGYYVIADHSGRPGTGISESKSLHRIEEAFLRREVEAAGFRLVAEGNFLRNPADPRDKPVAKPAQPNDEFVLKFQKP
jgi:predicted methyltransferase